LFFRQVLYRDLGCASYLLGDGDEAVVVDPRWDIDEYVEIAAAERLRITHVVDTHEHADHVSGRVGLAQATGAQAHRPATAAGLAPDTISPGDEIMIGALCLTALAAPGHRPEHLAFTVADLTRSSEPWMLLTGDSLLVGDIARPDLAVTATEGAHDLHASLRRLIELGDHVEVWPAHIGGSLCGGAGLSGKTSSTVGFERRHNPLLELGEDEFVQGLTSSLPSRPPNVDRIVGLNRRTSGPPLPAPDPLSGDALRRALATHATVIDCRTPAEFDAGHIAGSINLPVASPGVGTRAGWAFDPMQPVLIVAADEAEAKRMTLALQAVGFTTPSRSPEPTPGTSSGSSPGCAVTPSISSTSASHANGTAATSPARITCPCTGCATSSPSSCPSTAAPPRSPAPPAPAPHSPPACCAAPGVRTWSASPAAGSRISAPSGSSWRSGSGD
jgi:glyoxylase-like metal-dependent hydrolase (beta-lactamase superfamily II)